MQIPDVTPFEPGQALNVEELFKEGDLVDIAGTSIGKGFQGMLRTPHAQSITAHAVRKSSCRNSTAASTVAAVRHALQQLMTQSACARSAAMLL